ncbi:glycosyltransferase family protein [Olivibacter sitiensis]|uniref:glycosyltransferase family protein n=1 Tax=Olivibacter sitiensis TaxID=376470 RepID=UPI0004034169|nr:glycosyltransferase family protein [Olivibacter sitiensis]
MKVLYAIQGTGNGHLSRAMDIVPCLQKRVDVDVLISGIQADLAVPFAVKYRMRGLSFIFGKSGGVDLWRTFRKSKLRQTIKEIHSLPIEEYDLVITDFEPVSAWACYLKEFPCVSLSHQAAVLDVLSPKPKEQDMMGKFILKHYSPSTLSYGFHFQIYNDCVFTPVIRQQVREQEVIAGDHYTVYLPAYDDRRLIKNLLRFKDVSWEVFSKHNKSPFTTKNVSVKPIDNEAFVKSMATSTGVLCGAGFETPAEALFLSKKLMVVPMKNQYEQHLNAAALKQMGVPVIKSLKPKYDEEIDAWLESNHRVSVDYPDNTQEIIDLVLSRHLVKR